MGAQPRIFGTRGATLLAAFLGTGCLGDAVEAMTSAASDAPAPTSGTTETSSPAPTTGAVDGSTDATSSDDTATTAPTSSEGESTETTETTETTPPDPCAVHDNEACAATPGCRPITCRPYQMSTDPGTSDPWCLGEHTFVGCITANPSCEPMRTVACSDTDEIVYTCPTDCLPHGYAPCEPPMPNQPQAC